MGIPDGIETGMSPPRTHQGSFVPVLQNCPELAGGGGGGGWCLQYDILEILNLFGFFSNNCGTNI